MLATDLDQYFTRYGPILAQRARERFVPLHVPATDQPINLDWLLRKPYEAQAHAVTAIAKAWRREKSVLLVAEMGSGKAQPLTAKVLTPTGWKDMGDVQVGDTLIDPDGGWCEVLGVFPQGKKDVYRVKFSDGSATKCCEDHLWCVGTPEIRWRKQAYRTKSLKQIMEKGIHGRTGHCRHFIPMAQVDFPDQPLELDPYMLGVLLGDGSFRSGMVRLTSADQQIAAEVFLAAPEGVLLTRRKGTTIEYSLPAPNLRTVGTDGWRYKRDTNPLTKAIRELGLMGLGSHEKFIPDKYLRSSRSQRIALLQGLCDTDGAVSRGGSGCDYSTTSVRLAYNIRELVQSLGGKASIKMRSTHYTRGCVRLDGKPSFRLYISLPDDIVPFRLDRKRERYQRGGKYQPSRAIVDVEKLPDKEECQCILVNSKRNLYVTDDYIVTHNTYMGAAASAAAKTMHNAHRKAHAERPYRCLVFCPDHLIDKWCREITATIPDVKVRAIKRWKQNGKDEPSFFTRDGQLALPTGKPTQPEWCILGRNASKWLSGWKAAVHVAKRPFSHGGQRWAPGTLRCPTCMAPLVKKQDTQGESVPWLIAELDKRKTFCSAEIEEVGRDGTLTHRTCGSPLFQFTRRWDRWSPAHYIHKKMRGYFNYMILDECFPGDAPVATPRGNVPIKEVCVGDYVLSECNGKVVQRRVSRTIKRRRNQPLVSVKYGKKCIICTEGHKLRTTCGYVRAADLKPGDRLVLLGEDCHADTHEDVSVVREGVSVPATTSQRSEVLQPSMRCSAESGKGRFQRESETRVFDCHGQLEMEVRQSRSCATTPETSNRGRRSFSSHKEAAQSGLSQERNACDIRVGVGSLVEQRSREGYRHRCSEDRVLCEDTVTEVAPAVQECEWVYDLEVEETHCYFAYGALVSNCHEEKSDGSLQSEAAGSLIASCGKVLAMTGTLIGGYADNIRALLFRLSPRTLVEEGLTWDDSMEFVRRYGRIDTVVTNKPASDGETTANGRGERNSKTQRRAPGIMPTLYGRHLIHNTVFLSLEDVCRLPHPDEQAIPVEMEVGLEDAYRSVEVPLRNAVQELLKRGNRQLLGRMLHALLCYPDHPYNWKEIGYYERDKETGQESWCHVVTPPTLEMRQWNKERKLLELLRREKREGRQSWVFVQYTDPAKHDLVGHLQTLCESAGLKVKVLRSETCQLRDREAWIQKHAPGADVIISHPQLVETGLDLLDLDGKYNFPTLIFYETGYNLFTMRQASRRSWRLIQKLKCRIYYLYYANTMQERAVKLMGQKLQSSLALEGKFSTDGLMALCDTAGSVEMELAKSLAENIDFGPGERVWQVVHCHVPGKDIFDMDWDDLFVGLDEIAPSRPVQQNVLRDKPRKAARTEVTLAELDEVSRWLEELTI